MSRMMDQIITFSEDDARRVNFPHHDSLVIESHISNKMVAQILVDNGSSVNIPFKSAFEKTGLTTSELSPCTLTLYGLSREGVIPMEEVKLPVTLGKVPRQAFKYCTFLVVDCSSTYNTILGHSALVEFGAVTSIRHLCIKFPTESGIGTIHRDQKEVRWCYNVSLKHPVMVVEAVAPEQPPSVKMEVEVVLEERDSNELDP
ncbi:uncharacterized protein LOC133779568 [Humulus lupulus]|uniref:uncharacterized protein LOC133779568 n=1 Tax=Humulus lupulus TaxID=3486 RepID=UPI002B414E6D|nr:uncharacterized protein LOC133779568 [Humulus lupulus]